MQMAILESPSLLTISNHSNTLLDSVCACVHSFCSPLTQGPMKMEYKGTGDMDDYENDPLTDKFSCGPGPMKVGYMESGV